MRKVARVDRGFLTAGGALLVVGLLLAGAGLGTLGGDTVQLMNSYVFAWTAWTALVFGCLGLSLLHHAARGHWGFPLLRVFEAGGGPVAIGLAAVGFVPIALNAGAIYPWMNPETVAADPILQHRAPYMNYPFWVGRAVVIFAVLMFFAWQNQVSVRQEEKSGRANWQARSRFSAVGLVTYFVVTTIAWTDWTMSREDHWFSTIYGFWFAIGGALMAMGLAAAIIGTQYDKEPYDKVVEPWLTKDIGNLLLAMTMLWAYFSFSQYLITWSGNLPVFTKFFIARQEGMWLWLGNALLITQFLVPFLALLVPMLKRLPNLLAAVGGWIFVNRFFDWFYIIVPTYRPRLGVTALDLGLLLLLGGLWCLQFGWGLTQAPLLTFRSARLQEAVEHA